MPDNNALFDELLEAYRNADDPDRFLRQFLIRLEDATSNAVVAAERKLERLDAARARLDAAREIARPDESQDGPDSSQDIDDEPEPDVDEEREPDVDDEQAQDDDLEQDEDRPKKRKVKKTVAATDAPKRTRTRAR
jgi:hypothetical protein